MATLTVATLSRAGVDIVGVTPAAAGDEFANTGQELVLIYNGSGAPITVTLDIKPTLDGNAITDRTVTVGAGVTKAIGPFPTGIYNDPDTGRAKISTSAQTSVTIKAIKMARE